ncbi:MAG: DUF11 domain-containing protein [Oleispira sp.]|nr:DUF11 domain-containing protein [Oleispira sp.]MBL4880466.1 DUF11 domain-containing protein [Oleispira sp.]
MKIKQLFTLALAAGISATSVAEIETAYNLDIVNKASLTYKIGTTDQLGIEVNVENTFKVDRKVIFTLLPPSTVPTAPIKTQQGTAYTLVNNSNAPIRFNLEALNENELTEVTIGGQVIDSTSTSINPTYTYYKQDSASTSFDPNKSTQLTGNYIELTAGDFDNDSGTDQAIIYVVATPAIGENDDIFVHTLTVTAAETEASATAVNKANEDKIGFTPVAFGETISAIDESWISNEIQTVFNEKGAERSGVGAFKVTSAKLKIEKSVIIFWDPINKLDNPKAIPGAIVEYTLTVTNSGTEIASDVIITDTLPVYFDLAVDDNIYTDDQYSIGGVAAAVTFNGNEVIFPAKEVPAQDTGGVPGKVVATLAATLK